mgnify:CR=1 FL=1
MLIYRRIYKKILANAQFKIDHIIRAMKMTFLINVIKIKLKRILKRQKPNVHERNKALMRYSLTTIHYIRGEDFEATAYDTMEKYVYKHCSVAQMIHCFRDTIGKLIGI